MPLWGVADNNASEPKNLSTGEFQGTAGKAIYGVDNNEQGIVNGKSGDAHKYAAPIAAKINPILPLNSSEDWLMSRPPP